MIRLLPVMAELAWQAAEIAMNRRIRGCAVSCVVLAQLTGQAVGTLDEQKLERAALASTHRP